MSLSVPELDDRRFQELVDEAKRRLGFLCPEWTDHNVSDPGITLIELFAWMTEQYIYRLNQVPEKNFITFLNLIGAKLRPARAATGMVSFTLACPPGPERRIFIPADTEVATERTTYEEAVVFTTDTTVEVLPPELNWILANKDRPHKDLYDLAHDLKNGEGTIPFSLWPDLNNIKYTDRPYFYLGFGNDLSNHIVVVKFNCQALAENKIDSTNPPWRWQVQRGNSAKEEEGWDWLSPAQFNDTTKGFSQNGEITFYLPDRCQPFTETRYQAATWLRCTWNENPTNHQPYQVSPIVQVVDAYSCGISVAVTHTTSVKHELLGISEGQPGQSFRLQHAPLLPLQGEEEVVEVEDENGEWGKWEIRPDFGTSQAAAKHCVVDLISGLVEFGPSVRQTNGREQQYGAIPPFGRHIRVRRYRVGGGLAGNVAAGRVKLLKSSLPSIKHVENRSPITGGLEPQSLDEAKLTAPAMLRRCTRAVTADDFERLALEVNGVGRVRCVPAGTKGRVASEPGTVLLLVIPDLPPLEGEELQAHIDLHEQLVMGGIKEKNAIEQIKQQLQLPDYTHTQLSSLLQERMLLGTRLVVQEPAYFWVLVEASIEPKPRFELSQVQQAVKVALYRYLHPRFGGPEGQGWPFGLPLTKDKLYSLIQHVPGVDYVRQITLRVVSLDGQQLRQQNDELNQEIITVPQDTVITCYCVNLF